MVSIRNCSDDHNLEVHLADIGAAWFQCGFCSVHPHVYWRDLFHVHILVYHGDTKTEGEIMKDTVHFLIWLLNAFMWAALAEQQHAQHSFGWAPMAALSVIAIGRVLQFLERGK
jgi:hypothetical protein